MTKATLSADELLQQLRAQNEKIEALREKIATLHAASRSYLDELAQNYVSLVWWERLGLALLTLIITYLTLTLLALPVLLILPLAGLYWLGVLFLSEHADAHENAGTDALPLLEEVLRESIDGLNTLRQQLAELLESVAGLNDALDEASAEIEKQKKHMATHNHTFQNAVESLSPIASHLAAESEKQATHEALFEALHTTENTLETTVDSLQNTNEKLETVSNAFESSVKQFSDFVSSLENPELNTQQNKTDQVLAAADDALLEGDAFLLMAKQELRPLETNAPLRFFEGKAAVSFGGSTAGLIP